MSTLKDQVITIGNTGKMLSTTSFCFLVSILSEC